MKRRGFLGMLGLGAVAGPGVVKEGITAASRSGSGGVASMAVEAANAVGARGTLTDHSDHRSYLKTRILELRRFLSGQETPEQIEERRLFDDELRTRYEIETSGLRSVSEARKLAMMRRYLRSESLRRDRFNAEADLKSYLAQLARIKS
jgi:hypothetical protein